MRSTSRRRGVMPPPVDMLQTAPAQPSAPRRPREPSGNPLWAIPLSSLTATRDRPLFTPSRRPPAPSAVAAPPHRGGRRHRRPAEPERPQLTLVGAIVSDSGGIAIFIDQATNDVVRLRTGQDFSGWVLSSVKGREATLEKDNRSITLALPVPGEAQAIPVSVPVVAPGPAALPRPASPSQPGNSPHSIGAPRVPTPGDPRPLEDQL